MRDKLKEYSVKTLLQQPQSSSPHLFRSEEYRYNIVLIDYGKKDNIANELAKRGCNVAPIPHNTKAEDILNLNPDGIMLSNGPGDPSENTECIEELKSLSAKADIRNLPRTSALALCNGS